VSTSTLSLHNGVTGKTGDPYLTLAVVVAIHRYILIRHPAET
jgi:hypothetical protein